MGTCVLLHPAFGHHLLPLCFLQGSPDSVLEKAPIPAFGGAVHYSDHHRPVAPLATCPPDQLSVPVSRAGHSPAQSFVKILWQPLPISGQGLIPPGSPAPDCPVCFVSRSFVILFCLQRQELGKGGSGCWGLRDQRGRESGEVGNRGQQQDCAWGGAALSPGCGRHSRCI